MESDKKKYTALELAESVDGELKGDPKKIIKGVSPAELSKNKTVVFAENKKYLEAAESSGADLVITGRDINSELDLIKVDNPRLAYASIASLFTEKPFSGNGHHNTAVISRESELGSETTIGANAVVEKGAIIRDGVIIGSGAYIGEDVEIGEDSLIYPNVVIEKGSVLGKDVIIHSGTVIGADGFGYVTADNGHKKIPQLGSVIIEDDVEIGANSTVDRGTSSSTIIRRGTRIDNLVQIAHNVEVGKDCLVVAQVGIAGSSKLESSVIVAGQAGIIDHKEVGEDSQIAARSLVTKDVPAGSFYSGNPAQNHREDLKEKAAARKVPKLINEIKMLKKEMKKLKEEMN